ncbi:MAG: hypothetical protein Q9161_009578 [Pseudevernia consocians]
MDNEDARGLLKSILGFFARKQPERSAPASLQSQALDAWLRTESYLQHETNDFDDFEPAQVKRTLTTFENLVHYDSDLDSDTQQDLNNPVPYPKLQAVRRMVQQPDHGTHTDPPSNIPTSRRKRKREKDAILEELSRMDMQARKRRILHREEAEVDDEIGAPEADLAILTRRHSMSLHQGLRTQWTCVCQKCAGLSVRLSLPRREKSSQSETCFEVSFGIRSLLAITQQEGKITVKDKHDEKTTSSPRLASNKLAESTHICQSITESLDHRNCLHLLYEDRSFKRLRPQPKTFDDAEKPGMLSLADIFQRQQELHGGSFVLPYKGKRILAVTLATALLPFLETPWVQPSFNHSNIHFIQPIQHGELPDITKPFLTVEQAPIISARKTSTGENQSESQKHMVHPNASVLALGILLCELQYCRPVGSWQTDAETVRNINADYYTALDILEDLEVNVGIDYYLAAKACLKWEYFPTGELTNFESTSVQRLFYQNVIKRLESEVFKTWQLRPEDLNDLDSRENKRCWGTIGGDLIRQQTSKPLYGARSNEYLAVLSPPALNSTSFNIVTNNKAADMHVPVQQLHAKDSSTKSLCFFDASHFVATPPDTTLSEKWMDSLSSSIYHHVDPFDTTTQLPAGSIASSPQNLRQAIDHAVTEWKVDVITMSFGIREYHERIKIAISTALHNNILMFAAASNDGANLGRSFPAKYPGVFCIHATDGNGNPSTFNPTADEKDVNFSLLGENVSSHWPAGKKGHNDSVNIMSGTSVATPIAAGLAASIISFVRQQERDLPAGSDLLGSWINDVHAMDAILKHMVRQRRGVGYDYITPHILFDTDSSRKEVYNKIKDIKKHMYD